MQGFVIIFQLVGSLGFLLYGMKLLSDGIQKSASDQLHKFLNYMTGNRLLAVVTGICVTAIIQSSGATTVMVVSFVNAGLLSLKQAIGVIFGANIGTTVTAWIVSLVGFNLKLSLLAIPLFGIGYFITFFKKLRKENLGEAIMGFGLLFLGLDLFSNAVPLISADQLVFLRKFQEVGTLGLLGAAAVSMLTTMLLHSSSAMTAIILTLAFKGLLSWEFSAAMVLGSNIGSTIDAVLAGLGAKTNARRAALVHVFFNVTGCVFAFIFFSPFLALIELLVPGPEVTTANITMHIVMLHTIFNLINTLIFLPFVDVIARFAEFVIKPKSDEPLPKYKLDFPSTGLRETGESFIYRAEQEVLNMSLIVQEMFSLFLKQVNMRIKNEDFGDSVERITGFENYADEMQEELSAYLIKTSRLPLSDRSKDNVRQMLKIVDNLENITDDIFKASMFLMRGVEKNIDHSEEDLELLYPYLQIVENFIAFIHQNLNKKLSKSQLEKALRMEDEIDEYRSKLRDVAQKTLEEGGNVRAALLHIDLIRTIEKMGDHAYRISLALG